jgi:hypothetical protein
MAGVKMSENAKLTANAMMAYEYRSIYNDVLFNCGFVAQYCFIIKRI